jgi:4-hydroxy-2-oxoglutarate aldolase
MLSLSPTEDAPHPNSLCGYRCGNVGKLTRVAATITDPAFIELHPRRNPQAPFLVLGGYADIITSSAFVRGHGAITGLANIAPVSVQLVRLVLY